VQVQHLTAKEAGSTVRVELAAAHPEAHSFAWRLHLALLDGDGMPLGHHVVRDAWVQVEGDSVRIRGRVGGRHGA